MLVVGGGNKDSHVVSEQEFKDACSFKNVQYVQANLNNVGESTTLLQELSPTVYHSVNESSSFYNETFVKKENSTYEMAVREVKGGTYTFYDATADDFITPQSEQFKVTTRLEHAGLSYSSFTYDAKAGTYSATSTSEGGAKTTITLKFENKKLISEQDKMEDGTTTTAYAYESKTPEYPEKPGPTTDEYLTFTCVSDTGILSIEARQQGEGELADIDLEFSTDKSTWTQVSDFTDFETPVEICSLKKNESVYLRGNNLTGLSSKESYVNFVTPDIENVNSDFNVSGNVLSIVDKDDYATIKAVPGEYCFKGLFYKTNIIDASNLKLTAKALSIGAYNVMFMLCSKLAKAPKLEAASFNDYCYSRMFASCTSLQVYEGNGTQANTFLACPDTFQSDDYAGSMFMNSGGGYKAAPRAGYSYYYI